MDDAPTVAACQLAVADLEPGVNLDRVAERLGGLPDRVDVALFPEYALTGFVPDDRVHDAALERDGPELDRLADLAAESGCAVLAGFVEDAGAAHYNAVCHVTPAGERTHYRKRHRWGEEADLLAAGDEQVVVDGPLGRTGLVTCYDLNAVAVSAAFAREPVDALYVVGMWPGAAAPNWDLLVRARALDGVRWTVACGRTGRRTVRGAPAAAYAGRSTVVRPDGSVRAALNRGERDLVVDLDPGVLAATRDAIPILDGD